MTFALKPFRTCLGGLVCDLEEIINAEVWVIVQGFSVQAAAQGTGALGSLAKFSESFAPELAEKLEEIAPIG